jgi:hypothetical protein
LTTPEAAARARREHERRSALRAVDNPRQLARAARIVRAALERRKPELDDVLLDKAAS